MPKYLRVDYSSKVHPRNIIDAKYSIEKMSIEEKKELIRRDVFTRAEVLEMLDCMAFEFMKTLDGGCRVTPFSNTGIQNRINPHDSGLKSNIIGSVFSFLESVARSDEQAKSMKSVVGQIVNEKFSNHQRNHQDFLKLCTENSSEGAISEFTGTLCRILNRNDIVNSIATGFDCKTKEGEIDAEFDINKEIATKHPTK